MSDQAEWRLLALGAAEFDVRIEIFPISRRRVVNQERTLVDENPAGNQLVPYVETGGLRWGQSLWSAANATWPFARIYVSADHLRLSVNVGKLWKRSFDFERFEVRQIRRKRGLFSVGLIVEHGKPEYPPFILFWTFRYKILCGALRRLGYEVAETST
jgi:hypothetical protein